jgi:hypothetical protein
MSWIIVAGDTSKRTTRVFSSAEGRRSGSGGTLTALGWISLFTFDKVLFLMDGTIGRLFLLVKGYFGL